jgi:hypothetical protein
MAGKAAKELFETKVVRLADGAIQNPRIELFALLMADGVTRADAWRHAGYRDDGGSGQYRIRIERTAEFQARMKDLQDEKAELEKDPLFGEIKWMANQMWRQARCTNDAAMMTKAADLRWKIVDRETSRLQATEGAPAETKGRPGRPSPENPQATAGLADLTARLMERGLPAPAAAAPGKPAPTVEADLGPDYGEAADDLLKRAFG